MNKIFKIFLFFSFFLFIYNINANENWKEVKDYEKIYNNSLKNNTPFLLYFHSESCKFCQKYEENILNNEKLYVFLNKHNYKFISLLPNNQIKSRELFKKYEGIGYPYLILVFPNLENEKSLFIPIFMQNQKTGEYFNIDEYINNLEINIYLVVHSKIELLIINKNYDYANKILEDMYKNTGNINYLYLKITTLYKIKTIEHTNLYDKNIKEDIKSLKDISIVFHTKEINDILDNI
jgi:thiol-disulfide isomerase/thioredoxin